MKILVTGGAGYIGSFITRQLQTDGFEVAILDNLSQGHRQAVKDFPLFEIDLVSQKEELEKLFVREKFDGVIHMASFIQMGESYRDPLKYYRNNVIGAINLFEVMVKNNVLKFVFSSTAGVYGNPDRLPIEETSLRCPLNPYGETKYMIERMLKSLDDAHHLKYIGLRYFNAAGAALDGSIGEDHPNESHLIPLAIKAAQNGTEFTIFGEDYKTIDGTCVRDYIHVLDLATAHILALRKLNEGQSSSLFNAATGTGYSNKQVLAMVEKVSGKKINVKMGQRRPGDADALYASNEKIKKELGWQPQYSDLETIVKSAWAWHSLHPEGYLD